MGRSRYLGQPVDMGVGRKTTALAGLAGILIWSGLVVAASRHIVSGGAGIGDMTLESPDMPDAPATTPPETGALPEIGALPENAAPQVADGSPRTAVPPVRAVQPDVFAYPVTPDADALERIEARPAAVPKDLQIVQIKTLPVPRPFTVEAGLIAVGKGTLQIDGITPTPLSRKCESSNGTSWPCGIIARTNQRLFFRNRTLDCTLDSLDWQGIRVARCTLAGKSVGEWLVENGWAEAQAGSPLADKGRQAIEARLGLFGDDPR